MGFYFQHLPTVAKFIKADYDENDLDRTYNAFISAASDDDNFDFDKEYSWILRGIEMSFGIQFEKYEMLYFWNLCARNEDQYREAKDFMESLK
jgi:hypothetical protein